MKVRILGAGVAGLASAIALNCRLGLSDIKVYERDPAAPAGGRVGHGLLLMQNGVKALRALDADRVLDGYSMLKRALIRDDKGTTLHVETFDDVYCITRAALIDGLRAALPVAIVEYDSHCEKVDVVADGPRRNQMRAHAVRFRGKPPLLRTDIDLLIGADGARSALCGALNTGIDRPVSRVLEIVTSTEMPALAAQLDDTFIKTVYPDKGLAFGLLAPTRERVIGFLQFDSERYPMLRKNASPAEFRQYMQFILDGAPEPVPAYLNGAEFGSAHLWTPPNADLPTRLSCANAVLVGDAAHPLLPFTSQGVSAALEDAVILADRLAPVMAGTELLADALAGFCEARRHHMEPYIAQGRHILETFVDRDRGFAAPYVDGAASALEAYLSIPHDQLAYLFGLLDTDGDGYLDRRDFDDAAQIFELELSTEDRATLFRELDTDDDGRLKTADLIATLGGSGAASPILQKIRNARTPRRAQRLERHRKSLELFRLADKRKRGFVEFQDFGILAATEGLSLTVDALKAHIAAVDRNGDGRLGFREALALFKKCEGDPVLEHLLDVAAARRNDDEPDPLFAHAAIDETVLRARAFNHRWAEQPKGVIPLTAADSDFPTAEEILDAVRDHLKAGYLSYGPAAGLPELRRAAARRFRERRAVDCREGQVFVANSAASGLYLVAAHTLRAGDEALVADPCDFLFERAVSAAGATCVRYGVRKSGGHRFDLAEIESLITARTKLLTICNPHNPLGHVWTRGELEALVTLAARHDLWILSDEVWSDIVFDPIRFTATASLGPEAARRTFTVYGFSKGYSLAGLRLGLVLTPDEAHLHELVHRSHADETAYGVSTLSQVAGVAALSRCDGWLGRYLVHLQRQRDRAVARFNSMKDITCHVPEGTFVVLPDVSALGLPVETITATLKEKHGVAVVPGSSAFFGPGADGHIRLSLATSQRLLDQGLDRIESGFEAMRREGAGR